MSEKKTQNTEETENSLSHDASSASGKEPSLKEEGKPLNTEEKKELPQAASDEAGSDPLKAAEKDTKPKKTKRFLLRTRRSVKLLFADFIPMIEFSVLFRVLCLVVIFPVMAYLERAILFVNGMSNMAAYNALMSLWNPLTWIVFFLICLIVVFGTLWESGGIAIALHAATSGKKLSVQKIFGEGFDFAIHQIVNPKNLLLFPYCLLVLPLSRYLDNTSITRFIAVPGFIIEFIEQRDWLNLIWTAFSVAVTIIGLLYVFAIPIMAIEKVDFKTACRRSRRTIRTNGIPDYLLMWIGCILGVLIGVLILLITLFGGVFLFCKWLEPGTTPERLFTPEISEVIITVFSTVYLWASSLAIYAIIQDFYYRAVEKAGRIIPEYQTHRTFLSQPIPRAVVWIFCAVVIFFSVPPRYRQFKWMLNTDNGRTMIMAHRGYSAKAPENTIPAFDAAYQAGVKAVELDVQMLKDGTIIVMHDDNFARTCGVNKPVWEATYDEVKGYDAGAFFGKEFVGTRVPTLDEAIDFCRGKLFMNIEIKRTGHDEGIEKAVVDIIMDNDFMDYCDVTSQDYDTLVKVKEYNPDILTAYTTVIGLGQIEELDAASIMSIQETFATFENVERLKRSGKRVFVWTVNEKDTMDRLISLNVDAILTNDPAVGTEVLAKHEGFFDVMERINQILKYI